MLHWNWMELGQDTSQKCSNISVSSTRCQFSIIIEPLFESYNGMVSTSSMAELCRTTLSWLDQHCSLPTLRPSESRPTSSSTETLSQGLFFLTTCSLCLLNSLSGSAFTPFPEHHHGHPDRPQLTPGAGHPRCYPEWLLCCAGTLLTTPRSGQHTHHVTVPSQLSGDWKFTTVHKRQRVREDLHLQRCLMKPIDCVKSMFQNIPKIIESVNKLYV